MKKLVLIVVMLIGWVSSEAQNYVRLGDLSSNNSIIVNLTDLESNSTILVNTLPNAVQDSFKVFDFGIYLHNQSMEGQNEIANIYNNILNQVKGQSKYYLFFFRVVYYDGKTENKVHLYLPSNLYPSCTSKAKWDILQDQFTDLCNKTTNFIGNQEIQILKDLKEILGNFDIGNCCPVSNEQIIKKLVSLEFVPFSEEEVEDDVSAFSIYDFGKCKYQGQNIIQMMNTKLLGLPGPKSYFVTDNDNICFDNQFDEAKSLYEANLNDFDVWIHIYKTQEQTLWFIRFEQNIDLGSPISNLNERDRESSKSIVFKDDQYLGILSQKSLISSRYGESENGHDNDTDADPCPTYVVKTNGETFAQIVTLFEYDFFVADLQRWNPGVNGNNLTKDMVIKLFLEECKEEGGVDFDNEIGIPFDPSFNSYKWAYPNSKIKEEMISKGFSLGTISYYLNQPIKSSKVPVPEELKLGKYIVPEVLDVPSSDPNSKFVDFLSKTTNFITTIGRGAAILTYVLLPANSYQTSNQNTNLHQYFPQLSPELQALKIDAKRVRKLKIYVTYTKSKANEPHPPEQELKDGLVYAGRSSGYNLSPCEIVALRNAAHTKLNGEDFQPANLDHWFFATRPISQRHEDESYQKMRGREELIIVALGGPDYGESFKTRARNKIRGVALLNPRRGLYIGAAAHLLPPPYKDWDGAINICD